MPKSIGNKFVCIVIVGKYLVENILGASLHAKGDNPCEKKPNDNDRVIIIVATKFSILLFLIVFISLQKQLAI
ncbi:MAG: hypothetical protein IJF66_01325 [Clostridia bacterium]|nr:hypothetical protein [Clostridia bacterium]